MALLAGLERQVLNLNDVAEVGHALFSDSADPPLMAWGECYAYDWETLSTARTTPWHWTLVRAALIALALQRNRTPILAAYELRGPLARLFLFASTDIRRQRGVHDILAKVPGYIESGRDAMKVALLRSLAYWEPPDTLVALWPPPMDSRPGPYAVDAGNLLGFSSYPEVDHERGVLLDLAGPDYLRVPTRREQRLEPEGLTYVNRWAEIDWPPAVPAAADPILRPLPESIRMPTAFDEKTLPFDANASESNRYFADLIKRYDTLQAAFVELVERVQALERREHFERPPAAPAAGAPNNAPDGRAVGPPARILRPLPESIRTPTAFDEKTLPFDANASESNRYFADLIKRYDTLQAAFVELVKRVQALERR